MLPSVIFKNPVYDARKTSGGASCKNVMVCLSYYCRVMHLHRSFHTHYRDVPPWPQVVISKRCMTYQLGIRRRNPDHRWAAVGMDEAILKCVVKCGLLRQCELAKLRFFVRHWRSGVDEWKKTKGCTDPERKKERVGYQVPQNRESTCVFLLACVNTA